MQQLFALSPLICLQNLFLWLQTIYPSFNISTSWSITWRYNNTLMYKCSTLREFWLTSKNLLKLPWFLSCDLMYQHPVCSSWRHEWGFPLLAVNNNRNGISVHVVHLQSGLVSPYLGAPVYDLFIFFTAVFVCLCLQDFGLHAKFQSELSL